jgi:hypothetical protein
MQVVESLVGVFLLVSFGCCVWSWWQTGGPQT